MKKYHAKSPCCKTKVYHFGTRRRQCSNCQKTWRIRKKKIGRKIKRESSKFVLKYLRHELPSLYAKARANGIADDRLRTRLIRSREKFLHETSWPILPGVKPLIVIADAMVCCVDEIWYTFYFIIVKKCHDRYAVIAPPYVQKGTETWKGWHETFNRLSSKTKLAIVALVCDGHNGLVGTANREGWIIQRCHFHLIARLQSRRSKWRYSRHREEGKRLYALIKKVLTNPSSVAILPYIDELKMLSKIAPSSELRTLLKGFTKHYPDYRSYLEYPSLNLPRTSNAIESMIGSIQSVCARARGFRTIKSLVTWVNTILKSKQRITCNGFFQPN